MFASRFRLLSHSCGRYARFLGLCTAILLNVWMGWNAYEGYQKLSDETNIAKLNQKVSLYKQEVGALPDLNLIDLYHKGLTQKRLHGTPFGGFYRLYPNQQTVYNPNIASR